MAHRFLVVGLGEVLWDLFPAGPRFGGAPANFACQAAMLGTDAAVVSQVGQDDLGQQALTKLSQQGVNTDALSRVAEHPTGTVVVELDSAGDPRYTVAEAVAWDHLQWSDSLERLSREADAVCYGTLAQRSQTSRKTILQFLKATDPNCLRMFDVNLRAPFFDELSVLDSLHAANAVKLSESELPIVAAMCGASGSDAEILEQLRDWFELKLVALTRGAAGAILLDEQQLFECPAVPVQVADTVGAGDAFAAAMTVNWLRGRDLPTIARHASQVAAFVCTQAGAVAPLPAELIEV